MKYLILLSLFVIACGSRKEVIVYEVEGIQGVAGEKGDAGSNGNNGLDGTFLGQLEFVVVCPEVAGLYPETLIYLDGQYLAYYTEANSNWQNKRLAVLPENKGFKTTDGRNIQFKIVGGTLEYINGSQNNCADYTPAN